MWKLDRTGNPDRDIAIKQRNQSAACQNLNLFAFYTGLTGEGGQCNSSSKSPLDSDSSPSSPPTGPRLCIMRDEARAFFPPLVPCFGGILALRGSVFFCTVAEPCKRKCRQAEQRQSHNAPDVTPRSPPSLSEGRRFTRLTARAFPDLF